MINNRLVWFLETNNLITNFQSGFRNKRCTVDHLVRFETFIREAFIKKEHLTAVFFDLEKAYDTTWKYGIMRDLFNFGLKGKLPNFINSFLSNRNFNVRVGTSLSDIHNQEMGVPQGSILSVTLFSIKINDIVKCLNPGVDCSLYVDDFLICYRSKNIHTIERQLQQCLNKIDTWSTENGFKFSKTKTQCMHFCQLRRMHDDPVLKLDGTEIPVVDQYKFLGIIFDKKLSFIPHIKYLKSKYNKALQLLRVIAHTDWGADRQILLKLYRSLVRSKLDYGCFIYGSARKSYLNTLNTIHHQGLRLSLGAFSTSPVESLYAEAHEPPLTSRRNKLGLQYYTKLVSCPSNSAYDCVMNPKYKPLFDRKVNTIKPFGLRMEGVLSDIDIDLDTIHESILSETPPWILKPLDVFLHISQFPKDKTDSSLYLEKINTFKDTFSNYKYIYTDGSKINAKVGCSAVLNDIVHKKRLPDNSSIFSAELTAIDLGLDIITQSDDGRFVIFSDSLSVLTSLKNRNLNNPLMVNLLNRINSVLESKSIVFCWIPSHVGIRGNEKADMAAKESTDLDISDLKVPYTDFKQQINYFMSNSFQEFWNSFPNNKLYQIKPTLGEQLNSFRISRKEEVVLCRLRIGHTYFTHSFLLKGEDPPECIACQEPYTVKHILLDCGDLAFIRQRFYRATSLKDLFDRVNAKTILSFLKEVNLYSRI